MPQTGSNTAIQQQLAKKEEKNGVHSVRIPNSVTLTPRDEPIHDRWLVRDDCMQDIYNPEITLRLSKTIHKTIQLPNDKIVCFEENQMTICVFNGERLQPLFMPALYSRYFQFSELYTSRRYHLSQLRIAVSPDGKYLVILQESSPPPGFQNGFNEYLILNTETGLIFRDDGAINNAIDEYCRAEQLLYFSYHNYFPIFFSPNCFGITLNKDFISVFDIAADNRVLYRGMLRLGNDRMTIDRALMSLSPDGQYLACVTSSYQLIVYDFNFDALYAKKLYERAIKFNDNQFCEKKPIFWLPDNQLVFATNDHEIFLIPDIRSGVLQRIDSDNALYGLWKMQNHDLLKDSYRSDKTLGLTRVSVDTELTKQVISALPAVPVPISQLIAVYAYPLSSAGAEKAMPKMFLNLQIDDAQVSLKVMERKMSYEAASSIFWPTQNDVKRLTAQCDVLAELPKQLLNKTPSESYVACLDTLLAKHKLKEKNCDIKLQKVLAEIRKLDARNEPVMRKIVR